MRKCSECHENVAMLYVQDQNDKTKLRGLCLSCAKKLGVPGVDEMLEKMGVDDYNIDEVTQQMNSSVGLLEDSVKNMTGGSFSDLLRRISNNKEFRDMTQRMSDILNKSSEKDDEAAQKTEIVEEKPDNVDVIDSDKHAKEQIAEQNTQDDDGLIDLDTFESDMRKLFGNFGGGNVFEISIGQSGKDSDGYDDEPYGYGSFNDASGERKNDGKKRNKKLRTLEKYAVNLTEKAREGKIDVVIGREKEIKRIIQILNRRTKNNPVLIGEPGVGKTAIAEGLAYKIANSEVPEKLLNMEIMQLDMAGLVAGTQFRGQFESRLKSVIDEAKNAGNIILVIDELHTIMGAGEVAGGNMDAANILKPALANGEVQVLGATTITEYKKTIEKDKALERRFQSVMVDEPTVEESIDIIKGLRPYYEEYHKIRISDDVIKDTVKLSKRYITDRYLPDKAIDIIDEAGSKANLGNRYIHMIDAINQSLETLNQKRGEAMQVQDYEKVASYKQEQLKLERELEQLKQKEYIDITIDEVADVIQQWTKIPVKKLTLSEESRLADLPETLKKTVIGQDEAVDVISKAIKRNRVGISGVKKPSSFIFVGPTGVGKTHLVKQLAKELFGSEDMIIRMDMSEYMEKHSVAKMVGAPPGYVGYEEGGQLTDKVRRKPYSIILFDEIEKAHPDVFNMLLQILDEGRLTDAQGAVVHFENTVIIMTSNIGTTYKSGSLGFGSKSETEMDKDRVKEALKNSFKPEFLNRIDETVVFNKLSRENLRVIVDILLSELKEACEEKGIRINISDEVRDFVLEKGYDEKYGARPLKRTIQKYIEDEIADAVIRKDITKYNELRLNLLGRKILLDVAQC